MNRRLSLKLGAAFLCLAAGCGAPSGIAPALPPGVQIARVSGDHPEEDSEATGEDPAKQLALPLPEAMIRKAKLPDEPAPPTKPGESVTTKPAWNTPPSSRAKLRKRGKEKRTKVHYVGKLKDGTEFDSSRKHPGGKPLEFVIGEGLVILGMDEGVNGMLLRERRRLTIPPQLGYGVDGYEKIPPNATLIFDVELVSLERE